MEIELPMQLNLSNSSNAAISAFVSFRKKWKTPCFRGNGSGMYGEGFFQGQGRAKNLQGRERGLNLQGGAEHILCISRLKTYVAAWNLYLACVKWCQCCHVVPLWHYWIGKIQECHLYFAPPLPRHLLGGLGQGGAGLRGCFTGRRGVHPCHGFQDFSGNSKAICASL